MHSAVNQPMQIASIILSKETKYSIYFCAKALVDVWVVHRYYQIDTQTFTNDKQKAMLLLSYAHSTRFQQLTSGSIEEFKLIIAKNSLTDHFL